MKILNWRYSLMFRVTVLSQFLLEKAKIPPKPDPALLSPHKTFNPVGTGYQD